MVQTYPPLCGFLAAGGTVFSAAGRTSDDTRPGPAPNSSAVVTPSGATASIVDILSYSAWPTSEELINLAFDATSRDEFRTSVMNTLMACTGSDIAVFGEFDRPLTASNVANIDPAHAEAARATVLMSQVELRRANRCMMSRGAMVDTLVYSPKERERLPNVVRHQVQQGVTSSLVMSWRDHSGAPVVVNLCRSGGHYTEEQDAMACALVKTLAVADASLPSVPVEAAPAPAALTDRQREILGQVVRGKTNPEIARACGISVFTVRNHLVKLFGRYRVSTRTELALAFLARHPHTLTLEGPIQDAAGQH